MPIELPDFDDPYSVEAFKNRLAQDNARDLADIEQRRWLRETGQVVERTPPPQPETTNAAVRLPEAREMVSDLRQEITAAREKERAALTDALGQMVAKERERERKEVGDVIAEIAREFDQKLGELESRLRTEFEAQLRGLLTGLRMAQGESKEPDLVLDASRLNLRAGRA